MSSQSTDTIIPELIHAIRFLSAQGWTPATSSNFSCRLPADGFAISGSGFDKSILEPAHFLHLDASGQTVLHRPQADLRPSAETLLHALIYRLYPNANTVLHCHSVNATVVSKLYEKTQGIMLKDFEILKGFEGITTHQTEVWLPVFSNDQDMKRLTALVEPILKETIPCYGFVLAGHGLYAWGDTPAQARRYVEVFEFLFEAILKLRLHGYADYPG